jgi:LemA protein
MWLRVCALLFAISTLVGCGINSVIDADEDVKAAWSEVESQYKRRMDLIPNLIQTVKGASAFEQETLAKVVEARSKVASLKIDASVLDDPAKLKAFEQAQNQLSGSLGRLLAVAEQYPQLKATQGYLDLQAQLEGTENRIAVARKRFIDSVGEYNKIVLRFPSMIGAKIRGKTTRTNFEGVQGAETPPEVKF